MQIVIIVILGLLMVCVGSWRFHKWDVTNVTGEITLVYNELANCYGFLPVDKDSLIFDCTR